MEDIIKETQNVLSNGGNIIKTRDDRELILVDKDGNIQNTDSCGWLPENDGKINKSVFRTRIEPWLTSLFQSEHLSLLCGSGITNAVSFLAGGSGGTTMAASSFTTYKNEIEEAAKKSAKACGRDSGNIEDQIRTANDLLRGLRILNKNTEAESLEKELNTTISAFAKSIIIRKTKCFDFWERNVLFPKTKRSFFRTPKHPLPCPFPLNFSLLIITKKFGNLAKNRYICIV